MSLIWMDGVNWVKDDIGYKYDAWTTDNDAVIQISDTEARRTGFSSIKLDQGFADQGYFLKQLKEPATTFIAGFAVKYMLWLPTISKSLIKLSSNSTDILIVSAVEDGSFRLQYGGSLQGTGYTIINTAPGLFSLNNWFYFEVKFTPHPTAGSIEIRVNNITVYEATGVQTNDTHYSPPNSISNVRFDVPWAYDSAYGYCEEYIMDMYFCDDLGTTNNDFLGDCKIEIMRPNSPGTHTNFTPSAGANWGNVDELGIDHDDTYNQSSVVGDKDTYNLEDISLTSGHIFGIQQQSIVRKTDASIRYGKQVLRSGTIEVTSEELYFSDSFKGYHQILDQDPNTDLDWDETGVNALESGITITK